MPKVKGPKRRKGRSQGAPESGSRFRAAYKKSVKMMQAAIGMNGDSAEFPGCQSGNGPISGPGGFNKPGHPRSPIPATGTAPTAPMAAQGLDVSGVIHDIAWSPQPGPQTALLTCPVEDIFFGGARGGQIRCITRRLADASGTLRGPVQGNSFPAYLYGA